MRTAAICPTCATYENAICVLYDGPYLPCTGISPLDSIAEALAKIDAAICALGGTTTTSTTSTTTTEPPTTTTTTTSTTSTTSTTTTSTTTTTTTAPPTTTTTTSTTTTTTTVGDVNITLYARQDPAASTFPSVQFAYSTDGGSSWTNVGSSFTDTTCSQRAVVTVQQGSSLSIKISDAGNVNNTWQSARDTSTCPSFTSTACTWSALTNINRTYYFTMNGDNQGVC